MRGPRERAARLLRCYPRAWRARYGEEFTELLVADLAERPIAAGRSDPFYPGVQALARALPPGAVVAVGPGCHDGSFFTAQEPPSLAFLAGCLTS